METVSLKLDSRFAKDVEKTMKRHRYSTKTEFIREAIRDKITDLEKQEALLRFKAGYGASKKKTSNAMLRAARAKAFEEFD